MYVRMDGRPYGQAWIHKTSHAEGPTTSDYIVDEAMENISKWTNNSIISLN